MNLSERIRTWRMSEQDWAEMCDVQYTAEEAQPGPEGDQARERVAVLCESYADRLEASRLVRLFTSGEITPAGLRAEAAEWRAGRVPR